MSDTMTRHEQSVLLPGGCFDASWVYYKGFTTHNQSQCATWNKRLDDSLTGLRVLIL